MKLLYDHHLSRKLVGRLADLFPGSSHVVFHGLGQADDIDIWLFAQQHEYIIVTKDSDYNDISTLRGAPPKVIWLHIGNSTNEVVERVIRQNYKRIEQFDKEIDSALLEIL